MLPLPPGLVVYGDSANFQPSETTVWSNIRTESEIIAQQRRAYCGLASIQTVELAILRRARELVVDRVREGKSLNCEDVVGEENRNRSRNNVNDRNVNDAAANNNVNAAAASVVSSGDPTFTESAAEREERNYSLRNLLPHQDDTWDVSMNYLPPKFFHYWSHPEFDLPSRCGSDGRETLLLRRISFMNDNEMKEKDINWVS